MTREWTFHDKRPGMKWRDYSTIGKGPWNDEPDKVQWIDEATGLDCLIVRGPSGALCGYVGVPPTHPWHGGDYGRCTASPACVNEWCEHTPEACLDVHGGITFSGGCNTSDPEGICHIPEPGRPADVHWYGWDAAHASDLTFFDMGIPGMPSRGDRGTYRDIAYATAECTRLASQLAAVT